MIMKIQYLFFFLFCINNIFAMESQPEAFHFERLHSDIQRIIHRYLITASERKYIKNILQSDRDPEEINAIVNTLLNQKIKEMRQFLSTKKIYYTNALLNEFFINEMAHVYQHDPIWIAMRLNTIGARSWLKSYLTKDLRSMNRVLKDIRNKNRAADLFLNAIVSGDLQTIIGLIKAGVSPNEAVRGGNTALIIALQNPNPNQTNIIDWLIAHGAKVNGRSADGSTPLLEAARFNNKEAFRLLLEKGASPNIQGGLENSSPLQWAVSYGNVPEVQLLFEYGLSNKMITMPDHMGTTPLLVAKNKRLKPIEKLLEKYIHSHQSEYKKK